MSPPGNPAWERRAPNAPGATDRLPGRVHYRDRRNVATRSPVALGIWRCGAICISSRRFGAAARGFPALALLRPGTKLKSRITMAAARRPLVAGNWKMNGLGHRSPSSSGHCRRRRLRRQGRPHGLPAGDAADGVCRLIAQGSRSPSAARTATPSRRAPSPATFRRDAEGRRRLRRDRRPFRAADPA